MNRESLAHMFELMKEELYGKSVSKIYNSIGSNLFLRIGKKISIPFKLEEREEWIIWIGDSAWRITRDDIYIVGSGDFRDNIKLGIDQLLDRKIHKLFFTSDFLDLQIEFEDGYRLSTFFNCAEDNQWTIFMPNGEDLTAEFSNFEEIQAVQIVAKEFAITQEYISLDPTIWQYTIENVFLNKAGALQIILSDNYCIDVFSATWRIESNGEFLLGYFHDETFNPDNIFQQFIGKQITQIGVRVSGSLMDAVFQIGTDLILRTFAFTRSVTQWELYKTKYNADIYLCDLEEKQKALFERKDSCL
jgi:hypothetical protein